MIRCVSGTCRHFITQDYILVVVTNQSGIGRGYYTEAHFNQLTDWMKLQFSQQSAAISEVYFCPHHPDHALPEYLMSCDCRKPAPRMLRQAIADFNIEIASNIFLDLFNRNSSAFLGKNMF